ncbi:hypothetical protein LJ707_09575 [Mucilaginibacter sp. UR6-1]|uniref:hypothetical protein n=1 Tax=Mucilaginibacter sp. UR6-1 TaxID=1435643 RepID=UPI001E2D1067|nr:hypothetical protein [Mucilaginibacter sp. UR6-1]MCC8409181.1 hypothetical protein [Mucilaginibacter sp. UR6-1]
MKYKAKSFLIISILALLVLVGCTPKDSYTPVPFKLPKVPLVFNPGSEYIKPDMEDTIYRADSLGQRMHITIRMLDKKAAKLWRLDTIHFRYKNILSGWDFQKRGYYWLFQDLTVSSNSKYDKEGRKEEIHEKYNEYFMFHPVRQPERGQTYPGMDYTIMDEYWGALGADAVGISNPTDGDLFVLAHPIKYKVRGPDQYEKIYPKDSVAVPFYTDKVDSAKMICIRISIMPLNEP